MSTEREREISTPFARARGRGKESAISCVCVKRLLWIYISRVCVCVFRVCIYIYNYIYMPRWRTARDWRNYSNSERESAPPREENDYECRLVKVYFFVTSVSLGVYPEKQHIIERVRISLYRMLFFRIAGDMYMKYQR